MRNPRTSLSRGLRVLAASAFTLALGVAFAVEKEDSYEEVDNAVIVQSRGVDAGVDYEALRRFGPWDDRNYDLNAADVALLPAGDRYLPGVPAFFKVLKRKEAIAEGTPLLDIYPRETDKEFESRFGGLLQNGVLNRRGLGIYTHPDPSKPPPSLLYATDPLPHAVPLNGEGPMASGNNETAIAFNPVDPNIVIAGSNGSGGQRQNYSTDGGVTWFDAGALPSTCCDPALEWSSDGTVAYAASLGGSGSYRTVVYRSVNGGKNWNGPATLSSASSDKEYIHVDKSPTSPYRDNVYVTWHQSNVMYFARSTDRGLTFQTPISFASAERGIGSDITTDTAGNIYYVWPSTTSNSAEVWMVKSSDGGATFGAPVMVYDLHGRYDFAIPSMATRRAFIYVSTDVDRSGGPHDGRIYVAFTDKHPSSPTDSGGTAAQNHAWIRVAYSDDAGATWSVAATPHSEADVATVDRYHPWMEVDDAGAVHVGFYDTRNSANRTGVDFYYALSVDGGANWIEETRVSQIVSTTINNGQQWGDYNGLSVSRNSVVGMTWTDNRTPSGGSSPVQSSYVGRVMNVAAGPSFLLSAPGGTSTAVCAGQTAAPFPLDLRALSGFSNVVTLTTPVLDSTAFSGAAFSVNPVTPTPSGAASALSLSTQASAPTGLYPVTVSASDTPVTITRQVQLNVGVFQGAPVPTTLVGPANLATGVSLRPVLSWTAMPDALGYEVQVSAQPDFTSLIESSVVGGASYAMTTALATTTSYYWRVRSINPCGNGAWTAHAQFTTGLDICFDGSLSIPDNNTGGVNADLTVGVVGILTDLNVSVKATHTWPGDLELRLVHVPSSTSVTLGSRLGGTSCNVPNVDVLFDDQAGASIACASSQPGIQGTVKPSSALSAFNGKSLDGQWRLTSFDRASGDTGSLTQFCLKPTLLVDPIFADGFDDVR